MRQLQPVLWTKGTLLSAQHLQTQDRFLEDTLQFRLETLSFCPWGFQVVAIDREALAGGLLNVSFATGMFPDGLLFDIPHSDAAPPPKPLADHFHPDDEFIDVYLAVPHYRDRGRNVSMPGSQADTRYVADATMIRDEVRGSTEKPIQVARKGFRLLAQTESRQGHSALRIARVRRAEAGMFDLDPKFVPPLLDFRASDYLTMIARRLVETLAARSAELSAMRRHKNQSLADFTSSDIASFWLLYAINTHFPEFRHLFEVKGGHPEDLYKLMLSLGGALTTFSTEIHPRDLPLYDHDDPEPSFTKLDEMVRFLLDTVVPKNFVALPLRPAPNQPFVWAASLADDKLFKETRMYLAIRADMDHGDLIGRGPHLIKVCSASHIDHLVRHALPGVEMTHVVRPPASLPVKLNYEYFSLSQSGGAWEAIARARNLAAYVPGEFPEPEMELLVLLPQAMK